jgi:hypothetical protein
MSVHNEHVEGQSRRGGCSGNAGRSTVCPPDPTTTLRTLAEQDKYIAAARGLDRDTPDRDLSSRSASPLDPHRVPDMVQFQTGSEQYEVRGDATVGAQRSGLLKELTYASEHYSGQKTDGSTSKTSSDAAGSRRSYVYGQEKAGGLTRCEEEQPEHLSFSNQRSRYRSDNLMFESTCTCPFDRPNERNSSVNHGSADFQAQETAPREILHARNSSSSKAVHREVAHLNMNDVNRNEKALNVVCQLHEEPSNWNAATMPENQTQLLVSDQRTSFGSYEIIHPEIWVRRRLQVARLEQREPDEAVASDNRTPINEVNPAEPFVHQEVLPKRLIVDRGTHASCNSDVAAGYVHQQSPKVRNCHRQQVDSKRLDDLTDNPVTTREDEIDADQMSHYENTVRIIKDIYVETQAVTSLNSEKVMLYEPPKKLLVVWRTFDIKRTVIVLTNM